MHEPAPALAGEFLSAGEAAGLHDRLLVELESDHGGGLATDSARLVMALDAAGELLTELPEQPLLDRPLKLSDQAWADPLGRSFGRLLDASLDPHGVPDFAPGGFTAVDACSMAERRFAKIFRSLAGDHDDKAPGGQPLSQIVSDAAGPLLVRKAYEQTSALSLREVRIGHVPYPPGSLMALRKITPDGFGSTEYESDRPGAGEAVRAEAFSHATFLRLSFYGLSRARRHELADTDLAPHVGPNDDGAVGRHMRSATMADLMATARSAARP